MNAANVNTRKRELLARIRTFSIGFLLTIGGGALAATFNLFQPATGVLVGNASTYVTSAAANSDIISLWSGTCSNATYLRGDGSCQTPPGTTTAANPTATVGLTAVNGSASTYTRSDASPALSQSINPTWTGTHIFSGAPSSGGTFTRVSLGNTGSAALIALNSGAAGTDKKGASIYKYSDGSFNIDFTNESDTIGRSVFRAASGAVGPSVGSLTFGNATDNPTYSFLGTGQIVFNGVPRFNSSTATTVGAAGGAAALPATPSGYLIVSIAGTDFKIPYYAN